MEPNDIKCAFWRSSLHPASGHSPRVSPSLFYNAATSACEKGLCINGGAGAQKRLQGASGRPRDGSTTLDVGAKTPKRAPRRPKIAPRRPSWPSDGPRGLQEAPNRPPRGLPRGPQEAKIVDFHWFFQCFWPSRLFGFPTLDDRPRGPQDRSKTAQEAPKTASRRSKRPSRGPQDGPRGSQDGPRGAQDGPRGPQDGPKRPQEGPQKP